eukprot:14520429-Alexandrium_andersonii.AAC.1
MVRNDATRPAHFEKLGGPRQGRLTKYTSRSESTTALASAAVCPSGTKSLSWAWRSLTRRLGS